MTARPRQSDRPDVVQRAADIGTKAIAEALAAEGARAVTIFVTLHAEGVPAGELDSCTAGDGFDDAPALVAELLGAASSAAKQLGLRVHVVPQLVTRGEG